VVVWVRYLRKGRLWHGSSGSGSEEEADFIAEPDRAQVSLKFGSTTLY
jgi:hypothetical protein